MIRSLLVVIWILLFCVLTLPLLLFELLLHFIDREKSELQSQRIVRWLMKTVLWISGTKVTVKGRENIPEGEGLLFVPNHRSYFDFVVTSTVLYPFVNVGKRELAWPPLIGQWVWLIGTLLLNRKDKKKGYRTIGNAVKEVKAGKRVMIYPEGTRNKGKLEEPLRFKEGSLKISVWSGCKVIPVAMLGTRDIYENHRPFIRPAEVTVVFGTPVDPAELSPEEKKAFGARIRDVIIQMILKEEEKANGS